MTIRLSRWGGRLCLRPLILWLAPALVVAGCQANLPLLTGLSATPPGPAVSLAVDPVDGTLLKAERGLFRSADQGQSWETVPVPSVPQEKLRSVATSAAAPGALYVAGPGPGVLRSQDRGLTWQPIGAGLSGQAVMSVAVHSLRPDTLYAWLEGQGLFRTEDGGGRWQRMDGGPPGAAMSLAHSTLEGSMNTGWLYAATTGGPYFTMDCF